jgi:hypothetical protein
MKLITELCIAIALVSFIAYGICWMLELNKLKK